MSHSATKRETSALPQRSDKGPQFEFGSVQRLVAVVLAVLTPLANGWAFSQAEPSDWTSCVSSVQVDAWGMSTVDDGLGADEQLSRAVSRALAGAVGQIRGVYVSMETELEKRFTQWIDDDTVNSAVESSLTQKMSQRVSGLIVSFRVNRVNRSGGVVEASVTAEVCLDPRIAVIWRGPTDASQSFVGAIQDAIAATNWQVLLMPPRYGNDLLSATLETGATYVASVDFSHRPLDTYYGQRRVEAQYGVLISNATSEAIEVGSQTSFIAQGQTNEEAVRNAAARAGATFANSLLRVLGSDSESPRLVDFNFGRTRLANTSIQLQRFLLDSPGVVSVDVVNLGDPSELRMSVLMVVDPCLIAEQISNLRRLLIHVEQCSGTEVVFRVSRE
jgi:hypothetical protein